MEKLISKCCHSAIVGNTPHCSKCGKVIEPINTQAECLMAKVYPHHEPIQKEEVKTATEMMVKDMQEEEYYRIKHTPSDTFIEKMTEELKGKVVDIIFNREAGWSGVLEEAIKSSLQSQRQSILEEIEKKKVDDERNLWEEEEKEIYKKICGASKLSQTLVDQKVGYNQALEDIKQLLK